VTQEQPLSSVALEILITLSRGPSHGYAIKLDVEKRLGDGFILGSGSLYQAIQRLERRGLVAEATDTETTDKRRGRVYRLESAGEEALRQELSRMERVLGDARAAVAGGSDRS
jgi:DNA-binding PadR family transcriptional regulator